MPYHFKIEHSYAAIELYGEVTSDDLSEIIGRFRDIESKTGVAPHRVADFSKAGEIKMNFAEVDHYVDVLKAKKWNNDAKSAIVARTDLQFGVARMFQSLAENSQVEVRIFSDPDAAVRWVVHEDEPPEFGSPARVPLPDLD